MRMEKELGLEAYAIYYKLLEILREQPEFKYPLNDVDLLADEIGSSEQKVRVVICNYQLFSVDDNQFFSDDLNESLQPYLKMKEQRSLAGKVSAKRRIEQNSTSVQRPFNDRSTTDEQSKVNKSKVKESKVNNIPEKDFEWYKSQFDEIYLDQLKVTFSDKINRIDEAIKESYLHLVNKDLESADRTRCRNLLKTWLKNIKSEHSFGNSKPQWHGGVKCS